MILGICTACGKSVEQQIVEQLKLGQKYSDEQNYEAAIIVFDKVIELEPKMLEAYKGKSMAYEMQGNYVYAVNTLEQGFELIGVEQFDSIDVERFTELYTILIAEEEKQGNIELEKEYYEKILKYQPENTLAVKRYSEIETFDYYKGQLIEMMSLISKDEMVLLEEKTLDEHFYELTKNLETPIIIEVESNLYLGVYPQGYIYYGEMQSGKREGSGIWYREIKYTNTPVTEIYFFSGIWADDLPNGIGCYKQVTDHNLIFQMNGTYQDGICNGKIEVQYEDTIFGHGLVVYIFDVENGYTQGIGYNHVKQQIIARISENQYLVNCLENERMGILPFGEAPSLAYYY